MEAILFEQNNQVLFFIYVFSAVIGAGISVYFLRMYRLFSSPYIFGLMIGFALISFGDLFFSITISFANKDESFNLFHWLQLSITSYGFAFVALVYYLQKSTEKKFSLLIKSALLSFIPIVSLLTLVAVIENIGLPQFQQYNEYFRIVNMISIGYVLFKTFGNPEIKNRKELIILPLGFAVLFSSLFVRFLFTVDPMSLTLVLSGILKVIALGVIILTLTKETKNSKTMVLKHDT
ncbi:MAG: hypothetical protein ACT4OD_07255 [Candidatus Nitrosotenuis sp.]